MTAAAFVALVAAMEPTTDAEDSIDTINRLIDEARRIAP